jgi:hypothetical protein
VPAAPALIATFVVCGLLHDLVTMAVRGSVAFLFTPWFFFLGTGVVLGNAFDMDLSGSPWPVRAMVHLGYLSICLLLVLGIKGSLD